MTTLSLIGLTAVLAALYYAHTRRRRLAHSPRTAVRDRGEVPLEDHFLAAAPASRAAVAATTFDARHAWSSHRLTWLHFGFVFALGFVTLAFEYRAEFDPTVALRAVEVPPVVEIEVVRTAQAPPRELPPPPPPEPAFRPGAELELVEDLLEVAPEPRPLEDLAVPPDDAAVEFVARVPPPPLPPTVAPPPPPAPDAEEIRTVVERMPRYLGCDVADPASLSRDEVPSEAESQALLLESIYAAVRYPEIAREQGIEGTPVVSFVVERDGSISGVTLLRDPGAGLGREAVRVVEGLCAWAPGEQRYRRVRVQFTLPIRFVLE